MYPLRREREENHTKGRKKREKERCFVALGLVPDGAHSVLKGTQRESHSHTNTAYLIPINNIYQREQRRERKRESHT